MSKEGSSTALPSTAPPSHPTKPKAKVQVSLRLRPPLPHLDGYDPSSPPTASIDILDNPGSCAFRQQAFRFAQIFPPSSPSSLIFEAHRPALLGVLRGFDCSLLAYGTTGSGKTHTMVGSPQEPA